MEDQATQDGFERTFQVNHLAPFFLTLSLLPNLWAAASSPPTGARPTPPAPAATADVGVPQATLGAGKAGWGEDVRVVWVSSGLHKFGSVPGSPGLVEEGDGGGEADDGASGVFRIAFRQRRGMLGRWRAYADSKLLNAMMAAEGARRLEAHAQRAGQGGRGDKGGRPAQVSISSVALRPGTVVTDISRDSKVGQVLIGMAQALGLTRPLPRAAVGILHACTMPLSSPSASTSALSSSPSAPTQSASALQAPYDIYYDDTQPVQPHSAVLDARSTALAWQHSARLLREWKIRSGRGGGSSEESAPKAEVDIVWGCVKRKCLARRLFSVPWLSELTQASRPAGLICPTASARGRTSRLRRLLVLRNNSSPEVVMSNNKQQAHTTLATLVDSCVSGCVWRVGGMRQRMCMARWRDTRPRASPAHPRVFR